MKDGVILFAVITDSSGRVLREIDLDTMDRWGDVDANFPELEVRNAEAFFGGCFGDPSTSPESHWKEGYWKIAKN